MSSSKSITILQVRREKEIFVTFYEDSSNHSLGHARTHEILVPCIQRYSSSLHGSSGPAARPKRREAAQRSRKARNRTGKGFAAFIAPENGGTNASLRDQIAP